MTAPLFFYNYDQNRETSKALGAISKAAHAPKPQTDALRNQMREAFRTARTLKRNMHIIPDIDGQRIVQDGKILRVDIMPMTRRTNEPRRKTRVHLNWLDPSADI